MCSVGWMAEGDALGHVDAEVLQALRLVRVVGHQPHRLDAEVAQHLGRGAVVAGVGGQAEVEVGVDGVAAAVLQLVGLQLGDEADAASLVAAEVDHHSPALGDDRPQRLVELGTAVAALAAEDVAGQALAVDAGQHRLAVRDGARHVAVRQRDVLAVVDGDPVAVGGELAVPGGQPGLGDALDVALVAAAVAHQVLDRDHREAVLVGELPQLRGPLHRAVVVDDLDEHAGGREAGQPGEVDRCLGVPAAHQHAALAVAQREHVARAGELPRLGRGVGQRPRGAGAVGGADPGGDAVAGVDGDRVGRAQLVLVVGRHQRDLEPLEHVARHRHADDAAGVADGEGHQLGGRLRGGEDDVALVLPVLVVHHDDGLAGGDVGDGLLDGVEAHAVVRAHADTASVLRSGSVVSTTVRLARTQTTKPITTNTA